MSAQTESADRIYSEELGVVLDARPDTVDFRDKVYEPTLVVVPPVLDYEDFLGTMIACGIGPSNQGREGACTGFAVKTAADYLIACRPSTGTSAETPPTVSARMLYEMAKRYDRWEGEAYEGSSLRGAMKGWHKHGVCSHDAWPYASRKDDRLVLTKRRSRDARLRPLGAYFRVDHLDLVAMHAALSEVGVLVASAYVHPGWAEPTPEHTIEPNEKILGGHAFAIVGYDRRGFWIRNSWGKRWGRDGCALLTYDDWLTHGIDVWVARLGAPVEVKQAEDETLARSAMHVTGIGIEPDDIRAHVITLGNDGRFRDSGPFAMRPETADDPGDVAHLIDHELRPQLEKWLKNKDSKNRTARVLLFAHGGVVSEEKAIEKLALMRDPMMKEQIYPLMFAWRSDFGSTIQNIVVDALTRRQVEWDRFEEIKDELLDRIDERLEPIVRPAGKPLWDEMKENAVLATIRTDGGARQTAELLAKMVDELNDGADSEDENRGRVEVHVAGHSAGGVFLAPLVQLLASPKSRRVDFSPYTSLIERGESLATWKPSAQKGLGVPITSCSLWAPGITNDLFEQTYAPLMGTRIERFALFTLSDEAEQDDTCKGMYNKSLLYLVSNALEYRLRFPNDPFGGVPVVGLTKYVYHDPALSTRFARSEHASTDDRPGHGPAGSATWVIAPNREPEGSPWASRATTHGGFSTDEVTLKATIANVLGDKE